VKESNLNGIHSTFIKPSDLQSDVENTTVPENLRKSGLSNQPPNLHR